MVTLALLLFSLLVAALILNAVRFSPLLRTGILLIYAAWYLPILIDLVLPYHALVATPLDSYWTIIALAGVNVITASVAIASRHISTTNALETSFDDLTFPGWITASAYIAPILAAIELFAFKGISLSNNLAANRDLAGGSQTLFGQLGFVMSGAALILLFGAFRLDPLGRLRANSKRLTPFVLFSALSLLSGNRQFLFFGALILLLVAATVKRASLRRVAAWMLVTGVLGFLALTAFGLARQSATAGRQDTFLQAVGDVRVTRPDSILAKDYSVRVFGLYLYFYYGTEYGALNAYVEGVKPSAPAFSETVPLLYRRYSSILGLSSQEDVRAGIQQQFESTYGIFPRIWWTMYGNVYVEYGKAGIYMLPLLLALLGAGLVSRFGKRWGPGWEMAIAVFLVSVAYGVMFLAIYEEQIDGLLLYIVLYILAIRRKPGLINTYPSLDPSDGSVGHYVGPGRLD